MATLILAGTSAPFGCQRLAGVIGRKRFLYDLWGDAVNVQLRKHAAPVRSLRRMPAAFAATIDACLEPIRLIGPPSQTSRRSSGHSPRMCSAWRCVRSAFGFWAATANYSATLRSSRARRAA